ncbi:MAG: hypothetical protein ACNA8W_15065 [Bradymonadaceae bacterium]
MQSLARCRRYFPVVSLLLSLILALSLLSSCNLNDSPTEWSGGPDNNGGEHDTQDVLHGNDVSDVMPGDPDVGDPGRDIQDAFNAADAAQDTVQETTPDSTNDTTPDASDDTEVCMADICDDPDPTCHDAIKNGDETDVDCGGSCAPCDDGLSCGEPADCVSGVCDNNICQAPACDDGVFNGDETGIDCGGSCDPCPACVNHDECGDASVGGWSTCSGFSSICDTTGTQSRPVYTPQCSAGACTTEETSETRGCARITDDISCGNVTYGTWSTCSGFSGTCGNSGTQSRTVYTPTCSNGTCTAVETTELRSCTRNTNSTKCGDTVFGTWRNCIGLTECSTEGRESRTVTTYACDSGTCKSTLFQETRDCLLFTECKPCGLNGICGNGQCYEGLQCQ